VYDEAAAADIAGVGQHHFEREGDRNGGVDRVAACFRISTPTCDASGCAETTIAWGAVTGRARSVQVAGMTAGRESLWGRQSRGLERDAHSQEPPADISRELSHS